MTAPKGSKQRPHLPIADHAIPRDHQGRAFCRECHVVIRPGDPRHSLPDAPVEADHGQRAAGEGGEE